MPVFAGVVARVLFAAGIASAVLGPGRAHAFDAARCGAEREVDNARLAEALRVARPAGDEQECLTRIALLRLGVIDEAAFAGSGFTPVYEHVTRRFSPTSADPYPQSVRDFLAARLAEAEPAAQTDPVRRRVISQSLRFERSDPVALAMLSERVRLEVPSPPPLKAAFATGTAPAVDDLPPAVRRASADPVVLGELYPDAHMPRNTPPPHPEAAMRLAAAAMRGRVAPATGGGCLDPDAASDADVRRNREMIRAGLCVTRQAVSDGGIEISFTVVSNPAAPEGPAWYLPHDDEDEAFDAAIYAVMRYGGRMMAVDGDEMRHYRGIDLERTFATTAEEAATCTVKRPMAAYTEAVMANFAGSHEILSMHNNPSGGAVTVNVDDWRSRGFSVRGQSPDNLVFIAGLEPIFSDPLAESQQLGLNEAGLNVVHERVDQDNNDCSLSNYVVLSDGRPYFDIEAVHGSTEQVQMVDKLMGVLRHQPIAGG